MIVDGQTVGGRGGAGQGDDSNSRQLAGDRIKTVNRVVLAHRVELSVGGVEGKVVDGAGHVVVSADALRIFHLIELGDVEPAVVGSHEDIAVGVLGSDHGEVRVRKQIQAGVGGEVFDDGEGVPVDVHLIGVGQGIGVDLPCAVALAGLHGGLVGDKADHGACVVRRLVLAAADQGDLEGSFVAGIVADHKNDLIGKLHALFKDNGNLNGLAGSALLGNDASVGLGAGLVRDSNVSNVVVVSGLDGDVAGDQVHERALDLGNGVVDLDGVLDAGAVANETVLQNSPEAIVGQEAGGGDLAVQLGSQDGVVLRQRVEADGNNVVFLDARSSQLLAHVVVGGRGVLPGAAVGVVVSAVLLARGNLGVQNLAGFILNREAQVGQVADVQVVVRGDGVFAVHGQTVDGELVFDHIGVAHVDEAVAVGVLHGQVVDVRVADVGQLAGAVGFVNDGGTVEHSRIGPGAVVAQDGDGVDNVHRTLSVGHGLDIGVALNVEALGEVVVEEGHVIGIQSQLDVDLGGLGDGDGGSRSVLKEQLGVVGGDLAVAVHVGSRGVELVALFLSAGDVVQDGLSVVSVGLAVHVDVCIDEVSILVGLAVDLINSLGADEGGGGILQHAVAGVAGDPLDERIGAEPEFLAVLQRHDSEGVFILALLLGIVAQLDLDLAVLSGVGENRGAFVHRDDRLGVDRVVHVGKTGADTEDGPVVAVRVIDGMRGGHQQGVDELALRHAGLRAQIVLTDVLAQQAGHAVDLGSRHGGTGHQLVLVVLALRAAASVRTPDGVDGAAGSQNLRLHNQRAGNAVGGEGGNRDGIGKLAHDELHVGGDGHLAGVVQDVAFVVENGLSLRLDGVAVRLRDGDGRSGVVVAGEVHVDDAGGVVDDDDASSTLCNSRVGLGKEGGGAAVAHRNLAGQNFAAERKELVAFLTHVLVVVNAGTVHQDETVLGACDADNGGIAVAAGLRVEHVTVTEDQGAAGLAGIVHGSNRQGVGVGAGAAAGDVVVVVDVQVGIHRGVLRGVVPEAAVAHGDRADHAVLNELVHDRFIAVGEAEAGSAGAQRQVRGIAAEDDGVLNGGHVVGVVGAAALAEDLHVDDLGVGGNTLGADSLKRRLELVADLDETVGGGDACDVRAVLALGVFQVGDVGGALVYVVVAKADLGAEVGLRAGGLSVELILDGVDLLGGQQVKGSDVFVVAHALLGGSLCQGIFKGFTVEGQVILVDAGVDDGNLAAGAVVAGAPDEVGTDHAGGGAVVGLVRFHIGLRLIAVFQEDFLDAGNGADVVQSAVSHVCGDDVGCEGQVPLDVQLGTEHLLDLGSHLGLLGLQAVTIGDGRGVGADVFQFVTGVKGGRLVQNDGNADHLAGRMLSFDVSGLRGFVELLRRQCTSFYRAELQFGQILIDPLGAIRTDVRNHEGREHRNDQKHRQKTTVQRFVLHSHFSLFRIYIERPERRTIYGQSSDRHTGANESDLILSIKPRNQPKVKYR